MRIGDRQIGSEHEPYIIAEIGVNHDGSPERALALTRLAAEAGADAVKFQFFRADMLMSKASRLAVYQKAAGERDPIEMLGRLEIQPQTLQRCVELAHALKIHAIVSVFSLELVDQAQRLHWDAYKTASPDIINRPLLEALAATGKPLIVSTGASTMDEVLRAVNWLTNAADRLALLHCVSCYPTPPEQANPSGVAALTEVFRGPVGYSDHTTLVEFGRFMVGCHASVLEKHFTDDSSRAGPDHRASLTPLRFAEYCSLARTAWKRRADAESRPEHMAVEPRPHPHQVTPAVLNLTARSESGVDPGSQRAGVKKAVLPIEEDVRLVSRQSLTTRRDLSAGHRISRDDLTIKRPGTGIPPYRLDEIVGMTTTRRIEADMPLRDDDVAPSESHAPLHR